MRALFDWLAGASTPTLLIAAALASVGLYLGFSGLMRVRRIEDVPTARVRSAPQGYVELIGTAYSLDGEPVIAPLSKTSCCWYSYRVEERGGNNRRTVESGSSDAIFLLRDATGGCIIDPEGASVTSRHTSRWSDDGSGWGGHGVHARLPSLGRKTDMVVDFGSKVLEFIGTGVGGGYHYTESVILDGDPLYAIGRFHTVGSGERAGSLNDATGAILREWKRSPDTLRERFDSNRDGIVDVDEWQRARQVATHEAGEQLAQSAATEPVHTLTRPTDGRHFLVSNLEEFDLLRRYRWRARLGFVVAAVGGVALALMLSARW